MSSVHPQILHVPDEGIHCWVHSDRLILRCPLHVQFSLDFVKASWEEARVQSVDDIDDVLTINMLLNLLVWEVLLECWVGFDLQCKHFLAQITSPGHRKWLNLVQLQDLLFTFENLQQKVYLDQWVDGEPQLT